MLGMGSPSLHRQRGEVLARRLFLSFLSQTLLRVQWPCTERSGKSNGGDRGPSPHVPQPGRLAVKDFFPAGRSVSSAPIWVWERRASFRAADSTGPNVTAQGPPDELGRVLHIVDPLG
jgi:hypothetical protein